MDSTFWLERWQQGQIGFHQGEYNTYLVQAWNKLNVSPPATVFVPLCGKSLDMLWLRSQGFQVVGVEVAEQACEAFFAENQLPYKRSKHGQFEVYQGDGLTVYCGDFFQLSSEMLQEVDAVYDRAAMVAMPASLRPGYVEHLRSILPPRAVLFLVTMEYDQQQMDGPPFAVNGDEVVSVYSDRYQVKALLKQEVLQENPRFRERGVSELFEAVYMIQPR